MWSGLMSHGLLRSNSMRTYLPSAVSLARTRSAPTALMRLRNRSLRKLASSRLSTRASAHQAVASLILATAGLLVCLACTSSAAATQQTLPKSMGYIQATFSQEWAHLLMVLVSGGLPTIHDAVALTSGRMMTRLAQTQWYCDGLLNELTKECENGRLLRLLTKLSHVSERQELGDDITWGHNQDRHLLRLYRDSVFHANDEFGNAVVDFAQVTASLNRLDVGHQGKTVLSASSPETRGELLLVSYKEIRDVLERSFAELVASQESHLRSHVGERGHHAS